MDLDRLGEFCTFGVDRVYVLSAIARRTENPDAAGAGEQLYEEVATGPAELERAVGKLRVLARHHADAEAVRLYATVNARNATDCFFDFADRTNGWVRHRLHGDEGVLPKFGRVDAEWRSQLRRPSSRDETLLLWDVDDAGEAARDRFLADLPTAPELVTETPNGWHVVTAPFDYTADLETDVDHELKTDGLLFVELID